MDLIFESRVIELVRIQVFLFHTLMALEIQNLVILAKNWLDDVIIWGDNLLLG